MSKLFEPLKVGAVNLQHRVALAPLTRFRNDSDYAPLPIVKEYYRQRASAPGTLLISEATAISKSAAGYKHIPGIWSEKQIAAWKEVTDAVHKEGSFIFCQLWNQGRAASPDTLKENGGKFIAPSAIPMSEGAPTPEALTEEEIWEIIGDYASAAKNAIAAGFDGVEIHGANGYLIDQFIQDVSNQRTDSWGGSVEKRGRFAVEVTKAVTEAVGGTERVAIRLSPYGDFQGMLMADPVPQFRYVVQQLKEQFGGLAYIHFVESRISGNIEKPDLGGGDTVEWLVKEYENASPVILAGGYEEASAKKSVDETYKGFDVLIAVGRYFISNPDLVARFQKSVPLRPYNRDTFYLPLSETGYIDYPVEETVLAKI